MVGWGRPDSVCAWVASDAGRLLVDFLEIRQRRARTLEATHFLMLPRIIVKIVLAKQKQTRRLNIARRSFLGGIWHREGNRKEECLMWFH